MKNTRTELKSDIKQLTELCYENKALLTTLLSERQIVNANTQKELLYITDSLKALREETLENNKLLHERIDYLYKLVYLAWGAGAAVVSIGGIIFAYIRQKFL